MNRHVVSALSTLAICIVALTRFPATGIPLALTLVAMVTGIVAAWMVRGNGRTWTIPTYLGAIIMLLALPSDPRPWLDIPPFLTAFVAVVGLHLMFGQREERAPRVGEAPKFWVRIRPAIPIVIVLVFIASIPLLVTMLLPETLAASHELTGAPGLVFIAILLFLIPLTVATMRGLWTKEATA